MGSTFSNLKPEDSEYAVKRLKSPDKILSLPKLIHPSRNSGLFPKTSKMLEHQSSGAVSILWDSLALIGDRSKKVFPSIFL